MCERETPSPYSEKAKNTPTGRTSDEQSDEIWLRVRRADERGIFRYHLHEVAEFEEGGDLHVVANGVSSMCGRAAPEQPTRTRMICSCDGCGMVLAAQGIAFRVPKRVAAHTLRTYREMYVYPQYERAIR